MEYNIDVHEWPYLLPALQANLNHTPVQSTPPLSSSRGFRHPHHWTPLSTAELMLIQC
jgi:hypothetical protein